MARAAKAAQPIAQGGRRQNAGDFRLPLGKHLVQGRRKQGLGSGLSSKVPIPIEVAGVAIKILAAAELQRIDENADDAGRFGAGAGLGGTANQLLVSLVQAPHGGYEMERPGADLDAPLSQLGTGA
jgi:hypothetical protein